MKEVKRKRLVGRKPKLEVPPELIHRIQSLLPVKEAARTCILSKSWLHAWSTIPTLRFHPSDKYHSKQQQARYIKLIQRTLRRYFHDNTPIVSFDLYLSIQNRKSASVAKKWIRRVSSKSCLKELSLEISVRRGSFMLPDEIFSGENLDTLTVTADWSSDNLLSISSNYVINCVSLRVLKLIEVHVSEEVLNNLLSTCSLLEKVKLSLPEGSRTVKVKNLRYLRKLKIHSKDPNDILEIHDVPSLRLFSDTKWTPSCPKSNEDHGFILKANQSLNFYPSLLCLERVLDDSSSPLRFTTLIWELISLNSETAWRRASLDYTPYASLTQSGSACILLSLNSSHSAREVTSSSKGQIGLSLACFNKILRLEQYHFQAVLKDH